MRSKFVIAAGIVGVALFALIYTAVTNTAKAVVTVEQLVSSGSAEKKNIRLGARVADKVIDYQTQPELLLSFSVHGLSSADNVLKVVYHGIMPDTLKVGRDVIVEGDYTDGEFVAKSLVTQCPSKYEPPKPK